MVRKRQIANRGTASASRGNRRENHRTENARRRLSQRAFTLAEVVISAAVAAEYDKGVPGTNAIVFELSIPAFRTTHAFKAVFVLLPGGFLEARLQSPLERLPDMDAALNQILNSLQRAGDQHEVTPARPVLTGKVWRAPGRGWQPPA